MQKDFSLKDNKEIQEKDSNKETIKDIIDNLRSKYSGNRSTTSDDFTESPGSSLNAKGEGKEAQEIKKPEKSPGEPTEYTQENFVKLEREQKAIKRAKETYKAYQKNIIKSETLRAEISKGITTGEEPAETLKKALECIYLFTGDKAFYTTLVKCIDERN